MMFLFVLSCGSALHSENEGNTLHSTAACTVAQAAACGQVCQACLSGGVCDAMTPAPAGTICRPPRAKDPAVGGISSNVCDPAEVCDGATFVCPADAPYTAAGTICGTGLGIGPCDLKGMQACDGSGLCIARQPSSKMCKAAGLTICDPADYCDGFRQQCPANVAPAGTSCGAGKICQLNGFCS